MKRIILGLFLAGLVGCEAGHEERTSHYLLPPELKDCKVFLLTSDEGKYLRVVRCPNSSTNVRYNCGKGCTRDISTQEGCE